MWVAEARSPKMLVAMCDTAVVVRSGRVLFAKNSDRDPNEAQLLEWHPRRSHAKGARLRCTWKTIPEVEQTHAIVISRPFWMWGAEIGANEHGVVIGNEAVFTRESVPKTGLTGMDLLRLALERTTTAREAVETIIALAETHGQGGRMGHEAAGFRYFSSFIVADPNGAFVLETSGPSSAVEEVRGARSISNALSIEPFATAHSDRLRTTVARGHVRRACTERRAAGADDVAGMFALLRDHGGDVPRYSFVNGAMSAPCMHAGGVVASSQTVASWVAELTADGVRHWVTGTAAPCTSLFKPVTVAEPIDVGPSPSDRDDGRSLFWRHERLHRAVMRDPARLLPLFSRERDEVEARWLRDTPTAAAAFGEGDRLLAEWTERVEHEARNDVRPLYARRYWQVREARARTS